MGRPKETFGKKNVRNKQVKKRKEKEMRRLEKKEQGKTSLDDMIAYVDENGVITTTPPDLTKKKEIEDEYDEFPVSGVKNKNKNKIRTGRLKNYNEEKGFGFIIDSETKESIFVHANDCSDNLEVGIRLEFEIEKGLKGLKAINVKRL